MKRLDGMRPGFGASLPIGYDRGRQDNGRAGIASSTVDGAEFWD